MIKFILFGVVLIPTYIVIEPEKRKAAALLLRLVVGVYVALLVLALSWTLWLRPAIDDQVNHVRTTISGVVPKAPTIHLPWSTP